MAKKQVKRYPGRRVTVEDVEKIHKEWAYKTATQLAEELGLTKNQVLRVVAKLRKQGIDMPRRGGGYDPVKEYVAKLKASTEEK